MIPTIPSSPMFEFEFKLRTSNCGRKCDLRAWLMSKAVVVVRLQLGRRREVRW